MKQTIRIKTFETNSSSYHTLSIYNSKEKPKQKEIVKGQDLVIDTKINYKTIGYTDSYSYVAYNSYTKAQLVLRFIGSVIEEQLRDIVDCKEYSDEEVIIAVYKYLKDILNKNKLILKYKDK